MFARVTTYELEADRATEAVDAFAPAIESIKALDGLVDAYFLVECGGDRALSMTIWESQDAMERSRVAASRARIEAAGAVDVEVLSTYEFAVGIHGDGSAVQEQEALGRG